MIRNNSPCKTYINYAIDSKICWFSHKNNILYYHEGSSCTETHSVALWVSLPSAAPQRPPQVCGSDWEASQTVLKYIIYSHFLISSLLITSRTFYSCSHPSVHPSAHPIHSFHKYLWSKFYVPGPVLSIGNISKNYSHRVYILVFGTKKIQKQHPITSSPGVYCPVSPASTESPRLHLWEREFHRSSKFVTSNFLPLRICKVKGKASS